MGYWVGTLIFVAIQVVVTICINTFEQRSRHGCVLCRLPTLG